MFLDEILLNYGKNFLQPNELWIPWILTFWKAVQSVLCGASVILAFVDLVLEMFLSKISTRLLTIRPCTIPSRPLAIFLVAKLRKIPPMANPRYELILFYFIHEVKYRRAKFKSILFFFVLAFEDQSKCQNMNCFSICRNSNFAWFWRADMIWKIDLKFGTSLPTGCNFLDFILI